MDASCLTVLPFCRYQGRYWEVAGPWNLEQKRVGRAIEDDPPCLDTCPHPVVVLRYLDFDRLLPVLDQVCGEGRHMGLHCERSGWLVQRTGG